MTSSKKFERICVFYILSSCFPFLIQGQDQNTCQLQNVSDLDKNLSDLISVSKIYKPEHGHDSSVLISEGSNSSESNARILFPSSATVLKRERRNGTCIGDFIYILNNIDFPWALQMLDSAGKVPSGILRGAVLHWPGHYRECLDVRVPLDEKGGGNFQGKYCTLVYTLTNFTLEFSIGLCVPDSCSEKEIKMFLVKSLRAKDVIPYLNLLKFPFTLKDVECKAKDKTLDIQSIIYLCIVSIFITLTVMGSFLDMFHSWKLNNIIRRNQLSAIQVQKDVSKNQSSAREEKESSRGASGFPPIQLSTSQTRQSVPAVKGFLLYFSVFSNGQKLLNVEKSQNQLCSMYGLKVLNIAWVIYGHIYITAYGKGANHSDIAESFEKATFLSQVTHRATFSVDCFLVLSGFLLGYLFLKEADKKKGKINWFHFYLHRLWRLTPPFLTAAFFYMFIFKYIGSGPLWDDHFCDAFKSSWWKYVLYINNFIPHSEQCAEWLWYLGIEMQFYVISPLFLYPLWKWPLVGFIILGSMLFSTWSITAIISYSNNLIPLFHGVVHDGDLNVQRERVMNKFNLVYAKPYCRIAPYIIGVITGYCFHKTADSRNFLTWWQQLLGWIIALICVVSSIFGLYHAELSRITAMFYIALARSSFAIGVAWLVYACETGHGGFIAKLLSSKMFIPLSRLSYSVYLIHSIIMEAYFRSQEALIYFSPYTPGFYFISFSIFSYGAAFIFSLIFESPFMNIEKLFMRK